MRLTIFSILFCFFLNSCKKEDKMSDVPKIKFSTITDKIKAGEGTINLSFEFEDGDADLGNNPNTPEIFVYNLKDTSEALYPFPSDIPDGFKDPSKGMKGVATIAMSGAFFTLDSLHANGDSVNFMVFIKDEAGNKSNEIFTTFVKINP